MSNVVQHNMSAINSQRQLKITTGNQAQCAEKLSSGYRINKAADDAAGLAISEKMRRQIRGLTQASANANDGISFVKISEGALNEVHDMLQRMNELAVKAANDTLTDNDRSYIQEEMDALCEEINHSTSQARFNEIECFPETGEAPNFSRVDAILSAYNITVEFNYITRQGNKVDSVSETVEGEATGYTGDRQTIAEYVTGVAKDVMSKLATRYDSLFSVAATQGVKIGLNLTNVDGQGQTLAVAKMRVGESADGASIEYQMAVDMSDFNINNYNSGQLATTVAHEMTHLIMYDMVTGGMMNNFPSWFVEGMAQTSSGDDGWVTYHLNENSTDAEIASYLANGSYRDYGAGYLASMYLGYKAGGNNLSNTSIGNGLDEILTYIANKSNSTPAEGIQTNQSSLGEAIASKVGSYSNESDFAGSFFSGDTSVNTERFDFIRDLLRTRGTNGAGSVLGSLSTEPSSLFGAGGSYDNYVIVPEFYSIKNGYNATNIGPATMGGGQANGICIHVGSESPDYIQMRRFKMSADVLLGGSSSVSPFEYLDNMDISVSNPARSYVRVLTRDEASAAIDKIKNAIEKVSNVRSYYGAFQNRLEHIIKNLDNVVENTTSAESLIRDADMAKEMVHFSQHNILAQTGQSMLAQANQSKQLVLQLLNS